MEETNDSLVLLDWQFDKIISAATHSVRYIAKLGQIVMEETSISDVKNTVKDKVVCVKEPEIRKLSFQNLPVSYKRAEFSHFNIFSHLNINSSHFKLIDNELVTQTSLFTVLK